MRSLIPLLLLVGCGEEFSNVPLEEDGRFLAAAPSASRLRLSVGATDGVLQQAQVVEQAEFYVFTRQTVLHLNGIGFNLLRDIDRLVQRPPAVRARDFRAWSTPAQGLEPYAARFEMTRADDAFEYQLQQDTAPTITGNFDPVGGAGALTFDLDAAAALSGSPLAGKLHVDYALDGRAVDLAIQFEDFVAAGEARDASYRFQRQDDGAGTFDFAFETHEGAQIHVRSRWQPGGAGRADARVTKGGVESIITECWGESFVQTFYRSAEGSEGDPAECAFEDQSLPE